MTHYCARKDEPLPCLGVLMSCGHSFSCMADPTIDHHPCAARWNNVLFSLLMSVTALVVVWSLVAR